jgi:hypothetical protein
LRVSRPFPADDGATPIQAIKPECRRFPISRLVFHQTPFGFPAAFRLSKHHFQIKILSVHHMPYRLGDFIGQGFSGFWNSAGGLFPLIPRMNLRVEPGGEGGGFDKSPS